MPKPQPYSIRFAGGILDGTTAFASPQATWPLPDVIDGSNHPILFGEPGAYHKISESQLTEDLPFISRGAQYEWRDA